MGMTENEAISVLEKPSKHIHMVHKTKTEMEFFIFSSDLVKAFETAIQALEKVQALEENETYQIYRKYLSVGTVEEFKDLKEKAEPKEMDRYYCPICRHYFEDTDAYNYCPVCGQKMKSILE
jgi:rubrerythrin